MARIQVHWPGNRSYAPGGGAPTGCVAGGGGDARARPRVSAPDRAQIAAPVRRGPAMKASGRALRVVAGGGGLLILAASTAAGQWQQTIYVGPVKQLLEERKEQKSIGYKPLTEMSAADKHFGEEGGLYGGGKNEPLAAHQQAAQKALKQITPLDTEGKPSKDGKIVFVCLGMSNTGGVFYRFQEKVDKDPAKPAHLILVNCCWSAGASSWAKDGGTWTRALDQLKKANVSPEQVQVAWIKHAEPFPE